MSIRRPSRRNVRRMFRNKHPETRIPAPAPILDTHDPHIAMMVGQITNVLTGATPLTHAWYDAANAFIKEQSLGGLLVQPVEGHPDKIAFTWGMTLRAVAVADVAWGVGRPPHPAVMRKDVVRTTAGVDSADDDLQFAHVARVVLRIVAEPASAPPSGVFDAPP